MVLAQSLAAALAALAVVLLVAAMYLGRDRPGGAAAVESRVRGGTAAGDKPRPEDGPDERRAQLNFLEQAIVAGVSPAMLAGAGLIGAVACGLGLWALIDAPLLALLAAIGGAVGGPVILVRARQTQRIAELNTQFQAALEQMVAGLRAGATLHQAFEHVAAESPEPLRTEFRLIARVMGLRPAEEAIQLLPERVPTREVELFATAVAFHVQTGGSLTDVLLRVADLIRERQAFQQQVMALTAEGRMTTWLIAGMPVFLLGAFRIMAPGYMAEITASALGQLIIGAALVMVAVGVVIINRMVAGLARGAG